MWSIYAMEYYSAIRKDDYPTFASTWMELEEIMLSEITQSERQLSYGFSYLWNIKNRMEDIRRRKGRVKGGNQRGSRTMRDYGPQETN